MGKQLNLILRIVIGLLVIVLLAIITVPKGEWQKEADLRDLSRSRMLDLNELERQYYRVFNHYTNNPEKLIHFYDMATTQLKAIPADTLGNIHDTLAWEGDTVAVRLPLSFFAELDTLYKNTVNEELAVCPKTHEPYKINIVDSIRVTIQCPMDSIVKQSIWGLIDNSVKNHGYVKEGEPSWDN